MNEYPIEEELEEAYKQIERLKLAVQDTYDTSQELLAEKEEEINRLKKELNKHIKEGIEKDIEINKLTAESTEWESKCYQLQDRIDKAIRHIEILQEIIYEQPSKDNLDDFWLLDKLDGIKNILQGSDKE